MSEHQWKIKFAERFASKMNGGSLDDNFAFAYEMAKTEYPERDGRDPETAADDAVYAVGVSL